MAGSAHLALDNARDLIRWEKALGLYQELRVQRAFIDWGWFLSFWNIYYGTIHFVMPVVALVAAVAARRRRATSCGATRCSSCW